MQPEEKDVGYLWDMREAAREVISLTSGCTAAGYLEDRKLQLAVERLVEIIGEAARRITAAFQQIHPEIPWQQIISQRHVLAHEYGEIKQEYMWRVATRRVPELIALLEPLVPSDRE